MKKLRNFLEKVKKMVFASRQTKQTPKDLWKANFNNQLKAIHQGISDRSY